MLVQNVCFCFYTSKNICSTYTQLTSVTMPSLFLSNVFMKRSEDLSSRTKSCLLREPLLPASFSTLQTVKIYIFSVTRLVVLDYESMPFQIELDPIFHFAGSIYLKKPNRKNHYFGQIKLKLLFYFILVESGKIIWILTDTDPHTGLV